MRFYFHTESDIRHSDTEGEELATVEAARVAAARIIAEMLKDGAGKFWGTKPWTLTVTDADGLIYFTVEVHGQNAPVASEPPRPGRAPGAAAS